MNFFYYLGMNVTLASCKHESLRMESKLNKSWTANERLKAEITLCRQNNLKFRGLDLELLNCQNNITSKIQKTHILLTTFVVCLTIFCDVLCPSIRLVTYQDQ